MTELRIEMANTSTSVDLMTRVFAGTLVGATFLFLLNTLLTYWFGWPGAGAALGQLGWFGFGPPDGGADARAWLQMLAYPGVVMLSVVYVSMTRQRALRADAEILSELSDYIIRAAFWSVVIVGAADMIISFLRVEGLLVGIVGQELENQLGRPSWRGHYVHYPLTFIAFVVAFFVRGVSFSWLALLVVIAELQIVLSRFVFSYEQAFMGDLVRFWYASLFLFASAHALLHEAHVRVDVLYVRFSARAKASANTAGCLLLGIPLCWVILGTGMAGKGSSITSPLLSFEISQSGYGMYTKYMMAGFLLVFAVSMMVQFVSYLLTNIADLRNEPGGHAEAQHAES